MPDENKDVVENQDDTKTEDSEEQEDFVSPGVSGPSKGVLEKIAGIFKKKPEDAEDTETTKETDESSDTETKDDDETGPDDEDVSYQEIDPRFVSAAREYGWNDQRIQDYAQSHSDEDILTMVSLLLTATPSAKKTQQESKDDGQIKDELFDEGTLSKYAEELGVSKETFKDITNKMTGPLADRLNSVSSELDSIKGSLGKREEDEQLKEIARHTEIANSIFDKSEFTSLGKTKDIPKYPDGTYVVNDPTFQERGKVWDVAQSFYATGGTFEQAMKNAMQWYKGMESTEKDVERKVVKKLKNQEERVMPKRQEQHGVETYASEEDRKAAIINAAVAKYGKEYPS